MLKSTSNFIEKNQIIDFSLDKQSTHSPKKEKHFQTKRETFISLDKEFPHNISIK